MKSVLVAVLASASAPTALAHTVFTDFFVDGMPQGDAVAMRMNPDIGRAGSPIARLDSDDMACNVGGTKGVSRTQAVKDGSLLTFEIRSWPDDPSKESLDRGHKGPCALYLKKVDKATTDTAAGDGWFKVFDHGFDASTQRWCTDDIIDNKGLFSFRLPEGLLGGDYLARPEILALHAAKDDDPQFYTGCAQIFLESSGSLVPESTVSIPGHVDYGQPSTNFDIYNKPGSEYVVPGPKIAKLVPGGAQKASESTQSDGLKPEGCILENGNWCGKEVSSYTNEEGCWASTQACWDQSKTCWESAPPTGGAGCKLWQDKCEAISAECSAGKFDGPPNKDKVLTPVKESINVGLIMVADKANDAPAMPKVSLPSKQKSVSSTKPKPVADVPAEEPELVFDESESFQGPPIIEPSRAALPPFVASRSQSTTLLTVAIPTPTSSPSPTDVPCDKENKSGAVNDEEEDSEDTDDEAEDSKDTDDEAEDSKGTEDKDATPGSQPYKARAPVYPRRYLNRA